MKPVARALALAFIALTTTALAPLAHAGDALDRALPPSLRAILDEADTLELHSLECERRPDKDEPALHEFPSWRKATVAKDDRKRLLDALYEGVENASAMAMCFLPHHALVATRGKDRVELIVCFTCAQIRVHENDQAPRTIATTTAAAAIFGELLVKANPPAKHDGKTTEEWATVLEKTGARRWSGKLGDEGTRAIHALASALRDEPDPLLVDVAADALTAIGPKAAPVAATLGEALARGRSRARACEVLAAIGPGAAPAVPALAKLLATDDDDLRIAILDALVAIGPGGSAAAPEELRLLGAPYEEVAARAARALGAAKGSDDSVLRALAEHLLDDRSEVRAAAAAALGELGPVAKGALSALSRAAKDTNVVVATHATIARARIAGDAPTALTAIEKGLATDGLSVHHEQLIAMLPRIGGDRALAILVRSLVQAPRRATRAAAARALGELGAAAKSAIPEIEKAAATPAPEGENDEGLRAAARDALDRMRAS